MKNTDAWPVMRSITRLIDKNGSGAWESLLNDDYEAWVQAVLGHAVFLIGGVEPTYASATLLDDNEPNGEVFVATSDVVAYVKFSDPERTGAGYHVRIESDAVSTTSIVGASVRALFASSDSEALWPSKSKISLRLSTPLLGASEVLLPLGDRTAMKTESADLFNLVHGALVPSPKPTED